MRKLIGSTTSSCPWALFLFKPPQRCGAFRNVRCYPVRCRVGNPTSWCMYAVVVGNGFVKSRVTSDTIGPEECPRPTQKIAGQNPVRRRTAAESDSRRLLHVGSLSPAGGWRAVPSGKNRRSRNGYPQFSFQSKRHWVAVHTETTLHTGCMYDCVTLSSACSRCREKL